MRHEIQHNPGSGVLRVTFEQPGEQIVTGSGAMVARDPAIALTARTTRKTDARGGPGAAPKRGLRGLDASEGLVQDTFTATAPMQSLWIAPAPEGAIERITLHPGMEIFLQSGAWLASTPGITLDAAWHGAGGFFAGGLLLVRAYGEGLIWFSSYGGLHAIDVGREHDGYLCATAHLLAFTAGLGYRVRKVGGPRGLSVPDQGLVCAFEGHGRVWLQTRSPGGLAAFLHPFRAVGGRSR